MIHTRAVVVSPLEAAQKFTLTSHEAPQTYAAGEGRMNYSEWHLLMDRALSRWSSIWDVLQTNTPRQQWAKIGMYKNCYNIWRVARLLSEKKESMDSLRALAFASPHTVVQRDGELRSEIADAGEGDRPAVATHHM
jgi:hypothetical protein